MVIQIKEIVFSGREGSLKRLVITDETGVARKVLTSEWLVPGDYIQISPIQLQNGEDGFAGGKVSTPVVQEVVVRKSQQQAAMLLLSLIAQLFGPDTYWYVLHRTAKTSIKDLSLTGLWWKQHA
jgi:hypothetical protein